jgi:hypothetical protein
VAVELEHAAVREGGGGRLVGRLVHPVVEHRHDHGVSPVNHILAKLN